jgi:PEP-CTERM/exosortase A-associated glycosyltransferase
MRILHVLDHGLPLQSGYSFRTRAIVKAQIERGWEPVCLTGPRHAAGAAGPEIVDGITFHRTPAPPSGPSPLREWREIAAFGRRIDEVIRAVRPDRLHVHSPVLNALAALRPARRHGVPLLYEIRAFWEDAAVGNGTGREGSPRYRLTKALETWAAGKADAVAVICEGLRRDLVSRGVDPAKILVSPNGVDMGLFGSPLAPDAGFARELGLEDAEVIGFIGSFYDYEGLDDLIAAMPLLAERRPKARLLLVGGGPMEAQLRAQAAASPAAERILFAGRVPGGRSRGDGRCDRPPVRRPRRLGRTPRNRAPLRRARS